MKQLTYLISIILLFSIATTASGEAEAKKPSGETTAKPLDIVKVSSEIKTGNYAIIIGINDYDSDEIADLSYSEIDALAIYDVLIKNCGYSASHVYLYLDGKSDPPVAEKADFKSLLNRFYSLSDPQLYGNADTIFVYYSGHGANLNGKNYIIPVDGVTNPAIAAKVNIDMEEMLDWLKNSKFPRQVVYLDACRNKLVVGRGAGSSFIETAFKYGTGMHVMMATKLGDYSFEDSKLGHGIFTYYLLKALTGMASDENGLITVGSVSNYVFNGMAEYSEKNLDKKQIPICTGEGNYSIPIAVTGKTSPADERAPESGNENNTLLKGNLDELYSQSKFDKMIEICNQEISLNPANSYLYFSRGNAYSALNNFQSAISDYNKAIELDSNNITAYLNRANAYLGQADFNRAIADYNKAIELDPNNDAAYHGRGYVYLQINDFVSAISDFSKSIALVPNDAFKYHNRGNAYFRMNDFDNAILDYSKAIEYGFTPGYLSRGNAYLSKGDNNSAISDFTRALEFNPGDSWAYMGRGTAYKNIGNFDGAIDDLSKAIAITPDDAVYYNLRGEAYHQKGDEDHAIIDYKTAIEKDPNNVFAYMNCGNYYFYILGDFNQAFYYFDKAVNLAPQMIEAADMLQRCKDRLQQ